MTLFILLASSMSVNAVTLFFDDLTSTVFGHHQPLKVWVACLYFMRLNVSNSQIAKELDLHTSDVHDMTTTLRTDVVERRSEVTKGTRVYTDEYDIYSSLKDWGYKHKSVCHSAGEYARDDDGDGIQETHVDTMEGFWSLLRSWPRPHRGISQESFPLYLGFFEFVHNAGLRGKGLLQPLISLLVR